MIDEDDAWYKRYPTVYEWINKVLPLIEENKKIMKYLPYALLDAMEKELLSKSSRDNDNNSNRNDIHNSIIIKLINDTIRYDNIITSDIIYSDYIITISINYYDTIYNRSVSYKIPLNQLVFIKKF